MKKKEEFINFCYSKLSENRVMCMVECWAIIMLCSADLSIIKIKWAHNGVYAFAGR